jgi:hypothetical protein
LPAADTSAGINMIATSGKIALVKSQTGLPAVANPNPVDQPTLADLVGFGSSATDAAAERARDRDRRLAA